MKHTNEQLGDMLLRLSTSGHDGVSALAHSILVNADIDLTSKSSVASESADEEEVAAASADTNVDPFATDVNVNSLIALGVIEESDKSNLEFVVSKLAGVVCALRTELQNTYVPEEAHSRALDAATVAQYAAHYRDALQGKAYLEVIYDDPFVFNNLAPEEAAGLATALRELTRCERALWVQISNTGRSE